MNTQRVTIFVMGNGAERDRGLNHSDIFPKDDKGRTEFDLRAEERDKVWRERDLQTSRTIDDVSARLRGDSRLRRDADALRDRLS